jgi:hypothetical protein
MPLKKGAMVYIFKRAQAQQIFDQRPGLRAPFRVTDLLPDGQGGQVAILALSENHDDVVAVDTAYLSPEEPS